MPEVRRVAVTGGNGFIASHIILQLLESRNYLYSVTATVRSREKGHLIMDLPNAAESLTLAEVPQLADTAFSGHDAVIHVASPVTLDVENAQMEAAKRAGTVRTVIVTSCMCTLTSGPQFRRIIDETMWNNTSSPRSQPYFHSKVCAERAAWRFVEENGDSGFKLI
ncbi:hypothetical protein HDU83_006694, partial [Entophlyctis luteolus]